MGHLYHGYVSHNQMVPGGVATSAAVLFSTPPGSVPRTCSWVRPKLPAGSLCNMLKRHGLVMVWRIKMMVSWWFHDGLRGISWIARGVPIENGKPVFEPRAFIRCRDLQIARNMEGSPVSDDGEPRKMNVKHASIAPNINIPSGHD